MFSISTKQDDLSALPPKASQARRLALVLLFIVPFMFGALALFLGQDANWDLRNYHWYNAYALLNGRYGFDLFPSQTPYFYNPALDVPFFLFASQVSAKVAGFVLGAVQGLNFILLFMLCHLTLIIYRARLKVLVCAGLALMGLLGGGGIGQIGTTFYDNITSLGLFTSALLVIRFMTRMQQESLGKALVLNLLCGFPAGLMMGLKLPFVIFCIGLCGAFLFVTGPLTRRVVLSFGFGLGVLLGLMISFGPWSWFLYHEYANPVFPYFNDIFHSAFALPVSGRDTKFLPGNWFDRLFFPFVFAFHPTRVGEVPWRDLRLPLLYVVLPLFLVVRMLFGRTKNAPDKLTTYMAGRYLLWMAVLSYAAWLFLFAIYRYLLPLEMLVPLLLVVVFGFLPIKPKARALWTGLCLLLVLVMIRPADWGRREQWLPKTVMVDVPLIENSDQTMILMAGWEPYSYVIPFFPPEIPFIRIQSFFSTPESGGVVNDLMRSRVEAHKGPLKILIPKYQLDDVEKTVKMFDLTLSVSRCLKVKEYIFDSQLELCDLERTTKPEQP